MLYGLWKVTAPRGTAGGWQGQLSHSEGLFVRVSGVKRSYIKKKPAYFNFLKKTLLFPPPPQMAFWLVLGTDLFLCVWGDPNTYYVAQADLKLLATSCRISPHPSACHPELGLQVCTTTPSFTFVLPGSAQPSVCARETI